MLINKREKVGVENLKNPKAFIDYSRIIDDVYENLEDYNPKIQFRQKTAKISVLSSEIVSKYEFLAGKDVLPEKDLLEKSASSKRFECSLLSKEL